MGMGAASGLVFMNVYMGLNMASIRGGRSGFTKKMFANLRTPEICVNLFVITRTDLIMKYSPVSERQKKIARYAKALSHPMRLFIVEFLSAQTSCYSGNLSEILPIAKSTLSQHLKELKESGIMQGEIEGAKIKYCLNKENWEEAKLMLKSIGQSCNDITDNKCCV
jgi:ArsR family transcriptional regulator, arsenate/arsenite/antimonite-responsive transcriptional repressor